MNSSIKLRDPQPQSAQMMNDIIIDSIQDIKGKKIVKLDMRKLEDAPADFFIVCEGESSTQVRAISENVGRRLKEELGLHPLHSEGSRQAQWICLDYFDTVVHIFYNETRSFYELEDLWSDAILTEYETL